MPRPRIVFIDGLPGSGKSTAAVEIGHLLSDSRVFLESQSGHPLLVGVPDDRGAAFANIHDVHSVTSFASAALETLEVFLENAEGGVQYVFESHPIQSSVRVLMQLDASESTVVKFWWDLQDRLQSAEPRLLYFQENDARHALMAIIQKRGPAWERYVVEAFSNYPWMKARGLSGVNGMCELIDQYSSLTERLVEPWRFPLLRLPARPPSYQQRTDALIEWLANRS